MKKLRDLVTDVVILEMVVAIVVIERLVSGEEQ